MTVQPQIATQVIDMAPMAFRADVGAVQDDTRTVSLTFSTGADVMAFDWETGKRYWERLSMDPKHVRMQRLQSGAAPLLDTHSAYTLASQIGVVEQAELKGNAGIATVRFPKAEDDDVADKVYRKVRDRIIRNVSIGYKVYRFEELATMKQGLAVRVATDWEPHEISMVPMGADAGARVRSAKDIPVHQCEIVRQTSALTDADRTRSLRLAQAVHF